MTILWGSKIVQEGRWKYTTPVSYSGGLASKPIQCIQCCYYYAPTIDSCPIHYVDRTHGIKKDHLYFRSDTFDMLPITSACYSQVIDTIIMVVLT